MQSKRYCPSCNSFNISRKHRNFFEKYLLAISPRYICNRCHHVFTKKTIDENPVREYDPNK